MGQVHGSRQPYKTTNVIILSFAEGIYLLETSIKPMKNQNSHHQRGQGHGREAGADISGHSSTNVRNLLHIPFDVANRTTRRFQLRIMNVAR
jgi:hypothetical protein